MSYRALCSKCFEEKPIAHATPQGPSLFCVDCEDEHEAQLRDDGYLSGQRQMAASVFNLAAQALASDPRLKQPMEAAIQALARVQAEDYDNGETS